MIGDEWIIADVFEQDIAPLPPGGYPAGTYGRWTMDTLREERIVAVADTATDARLRPPERQALQSIGVGAVVGVPLVRDGDVVAVLSLHSREPRGWTDEELGLVQETADRTWPAVERVRAEAALRGSEERQAFLLELSDALRPLADPGEIQNTAARVLGEHLRVSRAMYAEVEGAPGAEVGTLRGQHHSPEEQLAPFPDEHRYSDYDKKVMASRRRGETMVVTDITTDSRFGSAEQAAWVAGGVQAAITVALVKGERFVAEFGVHNATPREWTADEVALVEAAAERTWAAVERARAEREKEALLADYERLRHGQHPLRRRPRLGD
jgi:GAF domain-containing protein